MVVFELGKIPLLLFGVNSTRLMVDSFCYKGTWLNRYDTDSPLWVLRMASARIMEMSITWRQERTRCHTNCKTLCGFKHQLSKNAHSNLTFFSSYVNFCSGNVFNFLTCILEQCFIFSSWGIVLVTTTASKQALLMREIAGPEKMPWVKMAYTLVAPAEMSLKERKSKMHYKPPYHWTQSAKHMSKWDSVMIT